MIVMNEFRERIKAMCNPKGRNEVPKEKEYADYDISIVEDIRSGEIFICTKEALESDEEYTGKISANNIENGDQIAEYKINALPGGRVCFGGYTDKECNKDKRMYSFADVWYKIYGKSLQTSRKFTKSELIAMLQEIRNKLKDAKFAYICSIKCKDTVNGKKRFEGVKYFCGYRDQEQGTEIFEMIDDDTKIAKNDIGDITITIDGQKIDAKKSEFEIELIASIGRSRVYSKVKYTPEACKQIVKDYERKRTVEGR